MMSHTVFTKVNIYATNVAACLYVSKILCHQCQSVWSLHHQSAPLALHMPRLLTSPHGCGASETLMLLLFLLINSVSVVCCFFCCCVRDICLTTILKCDTTFQTEVTLKAMDSVWLWFIYESDVSDEETIWIKTGTSLRGFRPESK